jgi:hypothetical protein
LLTLSTYCGLLGQRGLPRCGGPAAALAFYGQKKPKSSASPLKGEDMPMAWTSPTLVEICIGLEINGYLPAEY